MLISKFERVQLTIFAILTVIALVVMAVFYMRIPTIVGIGRYHVTLQLESTGGLYASSNVSYRGQTVGRVDSVVPKSAGIEADLNLDSRIKIPENVRANVHSRSAIGEQYVDLVLEESPGGNLENGDVIPASMTSVPQDVAVLIDDVNKSIQTLEPGQLHKVIGEAYKAFAGTGPQLQLLLDSSNLLIGDALRNIDPTRTLIKDLAPVLNSQVVTQDQVREFARNLAALTAQARDHDDALRGILETGQRAIGEVDRLFQDLRPTLPILLANMTSLGQVAVTYNAALEQIIVILPSAISSLQTVFVQNKGTTNRGALSFNLNLNVPEPCTVGFLPASERRDASALDAPERTSDPIFCALPQDSQNDVRGARNLPCMDKPGKRAPTIEICKSDEGYVPRGTNPFIGNPTPTVNNPLADQGNAQFAPTPNTEKPASPGVRPASSQQFATESGPPVSVARYNTYSGEYVGPDGKAYVQTDLASQRTATSWQTLLTPAGPL